MTVSRTTNNNNKEDPQPNQEFKNELIRREPTTSERFLAGALAGALSRFSTAPIDRVKLLFQINKDGEKFTFQRGIEMTNKIVKNEGVTALWRGCTPAIARILPYSATTFGTYNIYNKMLLNLVYNEKDLTFSEQQSGTVFTRFTAGALAGTTATALTYPLDLLHARSAAFVDGAESSKHLKRFSGSLAESSRVLYKTVITGKTGVRALYTGFTPTLMGIVPYGGISFAAYETLKSRFELSIRRHPQAFEDHPKLLIAGKLAAGATAGMIAQTVTYPLHIVRRRLQVGAHSQNPASPSGTPGCKPMYSSVSQGLLQIYRTEGFRNGLFKGVTLTWVKGPLASALGFTANDIFQNIIHDARAELSKAPPTPTPATYVERKQISSLESLIAGATAGACAKTTIAPLDRVKIIYQVDANRKFSLNDAYNLGQKIVRDDGVIALWRGNGVQMLRVIPYAATSFFAFPKYLEKTTEVFSNGKESSGTPTLARFIAGAMSGATATTLTYPLDLLRARFAAGADTHKKAAIDDLMEIIRRRGVFGLASGLTPTLLGIMPYAGISFATFETLKAASIKMKQQNHHQNALEQSSNSNSGGDDDGASSSSEKVELPITSRLLFGGFAGLLAQTCTYPLDIVRRRVQVHGQVNGTSSVIGAINHIIKTEGVAGLYKGLTMNWMKGPLAVAISFTTNDMVKNRIRKWHEENDQ
jgi:solute carrier family 25, member 42